MPSFSLPLVGRHRHSRFSGIPGWGNGRASTPTRNLLRKFRPPHKREVGFRAMSENNGRANPKPPSVDRLSLLWRRVNDHKMVQWTVAYVALAYGIQHGVILTSESFEWPNAVARISMLLLALGLPVVMTFAWYHGERASRQFTKAELSILSALLVIGSLLFYAFVRPSGEVAAGAAPAVQQAGLASGALSPAQAGGISIAVLPFANMSGDAAQEFFSDGMTEEITSALAKVQGLKVIGRTSAFQFKGPSQDLRA